MALKLSDHVVILVLVCPLPSGQPVELATLAAEDPRIKRGTHARESQRLEARAADPVTPRLRAGARQPRGRVPVVGTAAEVETPEAGLQPGAPELIAALEAQLDGNFERRVEQGLRHLSEYTWLGQSGLAAELLVEGANHIERGKAVRDALLGAIEGLRPAGAPPSGAHCVPREWHSYTILYDAYVADVPNRDIMSRLYISEGTFSRRRREALRAVARALLEAKRSAMAAAQNLPPQARRLSRCPAGNGLWVGWLVGQCGTC
jgi:hypothetical protein